MPICPLDEISSRGIPVRGIAGRFIRKKNESNWEEGMYHVTKTWHAIEADTVILQKS
jgi:hypothetical protein